ncbi:HAD family hydrolase [Lachnospiraceae bacterium 62-35]
MSSEKKRIVSFDLDQTLLDHASYTIPESAMRAIERLREHSYVILATGRDMDNYYSREYKEMVKPDGIIHLNGTKITVDGKLIFEHMMDKELLRRLFDFADERGYSIGATIDDDDYYLHPEVVTKTDVVRWGTSGRRFKDPWKLLEGPVKTLAYIGPEEGVKDIEAHFPELKLPIFAGKAGADIIEKTASKAMGLVRLCEYFQIPLSETVAFGDSMNDYEILKEAGIGVAMGNALEELKSAADYVTADIGDDGVWKACVDLGLF